VLIYVNFFVGIYAFLLLLVKSFAGDLLPWYVPKQKVASRVFKYLDTRGFKKAVRVRSHLHTTLAKAMSSRWFQTKSSPCPIGGSSSRWVEICVCPSSGNCTPDSCTRARVERDDNGDEDDGDDGDEDEKEKRMIKRRKVGRRFIFFHFRGLTFLLAY
jgi:hypothetical protein